jgi:hypothetical protein
MERNAPFTAVSVFFLAGLCALAIGAGAIARDFESGIMVLDRAHGAGPAEIVLGTTIYTSTLVFAVGLLAVALNFGASPQQLEPAVFRLLAVVAAGLVAWVAFLVLLGTLVPGSGNSAIALALVLLLEPVRAFDEPRASLLARVAARSVTALFPPEAVSGFIATFETTSAWRPLAQLAVSTLLFVGLAVALVSAREPAHGWKR